MAGLDLKLKYTKFCCRSFVQIYILNGGNRSFLDHSAMVSLRDMFILASGLFVGELSGDYWQKKLQLSCDRFLIYS